MRQLVILAAVFVLSSTGTAMAIVRSAHPDWLPSVLGSSTKKGNAARNGVAIHAGEYTSNTKIKNSLSQTESLGPQLDMSNTACALSSNKTSQLEKSALPQLKKLQEYEAVCSGKVTNTLMIFAGMPASLADASALSNWMASSLKEFARYNIRPLVILEPSTSQGLVNFGDYRKGKYDAYMAAYFQNLKTQGITDSMMGVWVPFPEPNIPEWDDTTVSDITTNIVKTASLQKKYFPGSKVSVLFDSMSYPSGSHSWSGGAYKSLSPYLAGIPKGLIDSFGYQGFPWAPPLNEGGLSQANLSATKFLQAGLAVEAAKSLGVNEVWLNTGSFARSHANKTNQQVVVSPEIRSQILQGVIMQAKQMKTAGLKVSINLFAEDKSAVAEGTDWSYWTTGKSESSQATPIFKAFVATARSNGFDFWLFDVSR